ncbi:MAG: hypothetical protein ACFFCD_07945 [Promethearchaeota archaeon]
MAKLYRIHGEDFKIAPYQRTTLMNASKEVFVLDDSDNKKIWIWIGKKASTRQKFNAARLAEKLDKEAGGGPVIKTIDEGEEPQEFLDMF